MNTTTPIHVVDDDSAICESMACLLAQNGYEVRSYASADMFLADPASQSAPGTPLLVVSDVRMPGSNGVSMLRTLRERASACGAPLAVILLSGHATIPLAVEAMREGAVHFLEKPVDPDLLLETVAAACQTLRPAVEESPARARLHALTPREREVLAAFVARGSNKAVANALHMSPRTVEVHRARIFRKSGASCVTELVRIAIEAGMVDARAPVQHA
ncbi:response regulator transcription factor [Neoroseomonas marina]|nr:response regulator [Neoroseomonas marina]